MTNLNGWALFLADSDPLLIICFHQQCPSMFTGPGHDSLLGHWFSKWGSKMNHILSVSWELVRNTILGPHLRTIEWGTLAVEPSYLCLNKAFWWFCCPLCLRIIAIVNCSPSRIAAVVSSLFCKTLLAVFLKWTNLSHCSLSLFMQVLWKGHMCLRWVRMLICPAPTLQLPLRISCLCAGAGVPALCLNVTVWCSGLMEGMWPFRHPADTY